MGCSQSHRTLDLIRYHLLKHMWFVLFVESRGLIGLSSEPKPPTIRYKTHVYYLTKTLNNLRVTSPDLLRSW